MVNNAYYEAGEIEGKIEGKAEGKIDGTNESILKCVSKGLELEKVADIFDVSIEYINKLMKKNKTLQNKYKKTIKNVK